MADTTPIPPAKLTDAQLFAVYQDLSDTMQSGDPGDPHGAGCPGWPAIDATKLIDGHTMRWTGRSWSRADAVA
ncbi:hypothetical protein AFCDBAGC_5137 [Methylobacterium cerastii]|uniref:Uncharacterized protein n=1 Tax=Methylobacterium cerastii TaxID=932741 RepID=A0ABQ4QQE5_9HYPH|nr:hypothetical protein [Methylobacterium cerastii]GJD47244.1 hypothetical protein AFCDBAGC_5137 [Methylobacterium cerastii]